VGISSSVTLGNWLVSDGATFGILRLDLDMGRVSWKDSVLVYQRC